MSVEDMPTFTIKGKDILALPVIKNYMQMCIVLRLHDQANEVRDAIREIHEWQDANRDLVKVPDHKHVPVSMRDLETGA